MIKNEKIKNPSKSSNKYVFGGHIYIEREREMMVLSPNYKYQKSTIDKAISLNMKNK